MRIESWKAGTGTAATVIDYTQVAEQAASEARELPSRRCISNLLQPIATLMVHALPSK